MKLLKYYDIIKEMRSFWGEEDTPAPKLSERKAKIVGIMSRSVFKLKKPAENSSGLEFQTQLVFRVGAIEVCEAAYLRLIGHPATKLWLKCKKNVLDSFSRSNDHIGEDELKQLNDQIAKHSTERRSMPKMDNAVSFVKYFADFHASLSPQEGEEHIRILPFETVSQLFEEYSAHCNLNCTPDCEKAGKETFRKAWRDCYKRDGVKFTRGKGTFPTCDICNNANDMLALAKSNSRWTRRQRDIIVSFKV